MLYYVTSFLDMRRGVLHSRPEALYFWVYFVIMNSFWIVIPACKSSQYWSSTERTKYSSYRTAILYEAVMGSAQAVAAMRKEKRTSQQSVQAKEHNL